MSNDRLIYLPLGGAGEVGMTAYVNGYSLGSGSGRVQSNIGYCPQFDALIDYMTGK